MCRAGYDPEGASRSRRADFLVNAYMVEGHNLIHFAAAKKHIGIYPGPGAVEHFAHQFTKRGLKFSKGAVKIPYGENLPLDLIAEIAHWCGEHHSD